MFPQASGAPASRSGDARVPSPERATYYPPQPRDGTGTGPRQAGLRGCRSRPALGRGHHLCPDLGRLPLARDRARRMHAADRRLGDGRAFTHRVGDRSSRNGALAAPTCGSHPPFRPGESVHEPCLRETVTRGGNDRLDGESRRLLRQRDGGELLRDAGVRTARPAVVPDAKRGASRAVRLHRRVLQHASPALGTRLFVATCLRKEMDSRRVSRVVFHCPLRRGNSR